MQLKRIPYFVSFGKWLRHTSLGFLPLAFQDLIFFCDVQHEVNLIELGKCSGKMSFTLLMINYFSIWRLLWIMCIINASKILLHIDCQSVNGTWYISLELDNLGFFYFLWIIEIMPVSLIFQAGKWKATFF